MTPHHHLVPITQARKVAGCAASYASAATCPPTCPLLGPFGGCYGYTSHARYTWHKVSRGAMGAPITHLRRDLSRLRRGTPYRYGIVGDLPGIGNRINKHQLHQLARACHHLRAWTYSHKPVLGDTATARRNRQAIAESPNPLRINLSANNPRHADMLRELDLALVVTVTPDASTRRTPAGRQITICPWSTGGAGCISCRLCYQRPANVIIGFPAHGRNRARVARMASESN